jgi:hypothetical protein
MWPQMYGRHNYWKKNFGAFAKSYRNMLITMVVYVYTFNNSRTPEIVFIKFVIRECY